MYFRILKCSDCGEPFDCRGRCHCNTDWDKAEALSRYRKALRDTAIEKGMRLLDEDEVIEEKNRRRTR